MVTSLSGRVRLLGADGEGEELCCSDLPGLVEEVCVSQYVSLRVLILLTLWGPLFTLSHSEDSPSERGQKSGPHKVNC